MRNEAQVKPVQYKIIIPIIIGAILGVCLFSDEIGQFLFHKTYQVNVQKSVPAKLQQIENKVATDAVQRFEIASKAGDKMQMYIQAGLCSAAFLQAKDEANYRKWLNIKNEIGEQLGLGQ